MACQPTVAAPVGDLDAPAVPDFLKGIDRAIGRALRTLIVDLSGVGFLSISGVQALVDVRDRATCTGLAMLLVTDAPTSGHTLRATGMTPHFDCFPSVRAAAEARRGELAAHFHLESVRPGTA
ncbi:STAS domain-containing protein [Rhodococcus olei]